MGEGIYVGYWSSAGQVAPGLDIGSFLISSLLLFGNFWKMLGAARRNRVSTLCVSFVNVHYKYSFGAIFFMVSFLELVQTICLRRLYEKPLQVTKYMVITYKRSSVSPQAPSEGNSLSGPCL